jgi:hypothetical protein
MALEPLAPEQVETSAPVAAPAPGLFDGQMAGAPDPLAAVPAAAPDAIEALPGEQPAAPEPGLIDAPSVAPGGEGEQVAAGGRAIREGIQFLGKIFDSPSQPVRGLDDVAREGTGVAGEVGKYTIIREADEAEVQTYFDTMGKTSGAPSPTKAQREAGIPTAEFNLENINGPDDLKAAIDNVAEMWKVQGAKAGRDKMSLEEIQALGAQMGFGPTVKRLLERKESEAFNAETIAASLQAMATSGVELVRLAKIASNSVDLNELLRFRQHFAFHAAISIQMKGAQMEAGRAVAAFRGVRTGDGSVDNQSIIDLMDEFGGDKSVRDLAKDFLALDNVGARNRFSAGAWSKVKGAWFEVWINGLLSAPSTQEANIVGNAMFQMLTIPEGTVTGIIGATRAALGSKADRVYVSETAADIFGMVQGIGDGFRLAGQAWRTEAPVRDLVGKVESAQRRAITGANLAPGGPEFFQRGIDYLGATIRLPGRALMTADEFFKAVAYRRSINTQSMRTAMKMRDNGSTREDIAAAMDDILLGQNKGINDSAEEFAQYSTFTSPVHGNLGMLGKWAQSSVVGRMLVPFFKTPVNIFKAGMERSPYGFIKAIANAKDPIKRDTLIARASLGTGAMIYTLNAAGEGRITGSGPTDHTMRQQLESLGWKKYSFTSVKDGVENPRWIQVGHMMTLHPEDVDYISYERMEPVSMILAIGADISQRHYWPTAEDETGFDVALSSLDVIFDYMQDQTFLQGFANIAKILGSTRGEDMAQAVERSVLTLIGSQVPYSSLLAGIERIQDPTMEHVVPDRNEPLGLRSLYAGLKLMDDKLPVSETDGPLLRDRFYTPRMAKNATVRNLLLLPMIADMLGDDSKRIESDPVMMAVVAAGVPLTKPKSKIEGVALTAEEQDRLLEFANFPPDDIIYGQVVENPSFYQALADLVLTDAFQDLTVPEQQTLIKAEDSAFKTEAIALMIDDPRFEDEFSELRARVMKNRKLLDTYGRQSQ